MITSFTPLQRPPGMTQAAFDRLVADATQTAKQRIAAEGGARRYEVRGAALELQSDRHKQIILDGPAGTGKSLGCLLKLHRCALKYGGMRGLIVRKTRESLTESALVTYEEKILGPDNPVREGPRRHNRQIYRYPNGSEIIVGGLIAYGRDQTAKIMSTEFDLIYPQECTELSEEDFEKLTTRLRNGVMPYQQIIGDCNPGPPTHWIKQRGNTGKTKLLQSRHEDNPALYDPATGDWTASGREYIDVLDNLTGVRYKRLRLGLWVAAEGMVYEEWDRADHVIPIRPFPADWRRIRVIDFGFNNPFVCQWWTISPDGTLFMYREIYRTGRITEDHAEQVARLSLGERIEATICDHDAEDRATLERHLKIRTLPAVKPISRGIQAVQKRLRKDGKGKRGLYLCEGSLVDIDQSLVFKKKPFSTEQEVESYVWPIGVDGKPLKEVPVDEDNHGMDAMRYAVAYVDKWNKARLGQGAAQSASAFGG